MHSEPPRHVRLRLALAVSFAVGAVSCQSTSASDLNWAADAGVFGKPDAAWVKSGDAPATIVIAPDAPFAPISIDSGARAAIDAGVTADETSCLPSVYTLRARPAEVLLVQDRSAAMAELVGTDSKWSMSGAAIVKVAELATASWGMMLFPKATLDGECCQMPSSDLAAEVEVMPSSGSAALLATTFQTSAATGRGRPMARAITQAASYLHARATSSAKYLVLVAAGEPTCSEDGLCSAENTSDATRTKDAVTHAASRLGIPVAVVALGLPSNSNVLQPVATQQLFADLAKLGGMGSATSSQQAYWAAATTGELERVLAAIAAQTKNCSFVVPAPIVRPADVQVLLSDVRLSRDSTHQDGWDFADDETSVVLFGKACTAARTALDAVVMRLQPSCSAPPVL